MRGRGHILISQVNLKVLIIPGISVYEGENLLNYHLVEQLFQHQEQDSRTQFHNLPIELPPPPAFLFQEVMTLFRLIN
jgi:hypothetical protein